MAVVRAFDEDAYAPEYGRVVLRDPAAPGDDETAGTFAGAGTGRSPAWPAARS